MEATEKLLSTEQAANSGLRAQTSELTSELGSVKEALADTAAQLEEERSSSSELRSQLEAIKSEYITAGACKWGLETFSDGSTGVVVDWRSLLCWLGAAPHADCLHTG